MKTVYIMRGVHGSFKTFTAKKLAGKNGVVHSTEDYCFLIDGKLKFDDSVRARVNRQCFEDFHRSLRSGIEIVVFDNTNIIPYRYKRFVDAAKDFGYLPIIVTMPDPNTDIAASRTKYAVTSAYISQQINWWKN